MSTENENLQEEKRQIDIRRGERLKLLRSMANISASVLAEKVGISRPTISFWENAKYPLSERGARKLIPIFQNLGINCTFAWLWNGSGNKPSFFKEDSDDQAPSTISHGSILPSVDREIALFLKSDPNAIVLKIGSTVYQPTFEYNDIVGGIWQPINSFRSDCFAIIKIEDNSHIKWIKKINKDDKKIYYEASNFPGDKSEQINIDQFAPIVRLWRF